MTRRIACLLVPAALLLAGCGGGAAANKPAPGTPENPLVAKASEPSSEPTSGKGSQGGNGSPFSQIVQGQTKHPESRFTPCNLVTRPQARAIMGAVQAPLEAPQGPTCIYRAAKGSDQVTIAVQDGIQFAQVKKLLQHRKAVDASGRTGYCGMYGQPVLYVPLSGGRVLTIQGECGVAKQFAAKAVRQLRG